MYSVLCDKKIVMFGSADSEHPMLISHFRNIPSPTCVATPPYLNVTDGRTDRRTTCRGNTALSVELNEIIASSVLCYNNWYLLAMISIFIK